MARPKGITEQTPREQRHIVDCLPCTGLGYIAGQECTDCKGLGYRNTKKKYRTKWVLLK